MTEYKLIARLNEACTVPLAKGAEAFSPITNGYNRQHRVCFLCLRV